MSKQEKPAEPSALQRAALLVEKMQARLDAVERARTEPIAVIGMGCRFPGGAVDGPSYWKLLRDGVDALSEVPTSRWDVPGHYDSTRGVPGKMYGIRGGFLDDVEHFDAGFFGISPREAANLDPQQRLVLEVAWEALENAGLAPDQLAGSKTGVFMGVMSSDYMARLLKENDATRFDGYAATGNGYSFVPGRLSYVLGLQGPCMPVDTACSSSLVALHLASESLRAGESNLALVGGVNLILSPETTICLCSMQALAGDGRCKTFDASADGYVRGEGCGVLVLKRLSDAQRDGDSILALIRGSAVNHDGASGGLTVPNGPAQQAVVQRALDNARIAPALVSYVEAHGTGTPLGDPIELRALGSVLGKGRPGDRPFFIGSVKTNIGHLEPAAGIAGVIKTILSLQHREIPQHLHFRTPNPHVEWDRIPVRVPIERVPWPAYEGRRIAGVSSFGLSGINAHVVLEEAPAPTAAPAEDGKPQLVVLSAKTPRALSALAEAWCSFLKSEEAGTLADISYTAALCRTHHDHRLALAARSRQELIEQLEAFAAGESHAGLSAGRRGAGLAQKIVFVFPGQGSQWLGMGRRLYAEDATFRGAIDRCHEAMRRYADWSLRELLTNPEQQPRWNDIDVIQPMLFALQVALAAVWRSYGLEPHAVVGHSMGEVAAAHVAGALSLEDAARIICERSKLLKRVSGQGAMAVVDLSREQAEAEIRGTEDRISIAVSNGPKSTVLSGDPAALKEVLERLQRREVFCRWVKVDVASHSPQMDPLRQELLERMAGIRPTGSSVPLYSTVTGAPIDGRELGASYWVRNLRQPVLFADTVQRLIQDGNVLFIELSPHPILVPFVDAMLREGDTSGRGLVVPSLLREQEEWSSLLSSLGALYTRVDRVDWLRLHPGKRRRVALPTYPWQRERHWLDLEPAATRGRFVRAGAGAHPLLGPSFTTSVHEETRFWESTLSAREPSYLADHRVGGAVVMPGAAYLEMALSAAREVSAEVTHELVDTSFKEGLLLPEGQTRTVQMALSDEGGGALSFQLSSQKASTDASAPAGWMAHVVGRIRPIQGGQPAQAPESLDAVRERCPEVIAQAAHYEELARRGIAYGPAFQGVHQVWRGRAEALGHVRLPEQLAARASAYRIHPALLDACFQLVAAAVPQEDITPDSGPAVPVALACLRLHEQPGTEVFCHVRLRTREGGRSGTYEFDLSLRDASGRLLVEALGLRIQQLEFAASECAGKDLFFSLEWRHEPTTQPALPEAHDVSGRWLLVADGSELADEVESLLRARHGDVFRVDIAGAGQGRRVVDAASPQAFDGVLAEAFGAGTVPRGVIHLAALGLVPGQEVSLEPREVGPMMGCASVLHLVQALSRASQARMPRLWLVTRGVHDDTASGSASAVMQAPMWGLGRTLAHEHSELKCTRVDVSAAMGPGDAGAALVRELLVADAEEEISVRADGRHVARIVRGSPGGSSEEAVVPAQGRPAEARRLRADGTYLVTGGLGGLGLSVAKWMVEQGAGHLVLVGRDTALTPEQRDAVAGLEAAGARVMVARADVSDRAQLARVLSEVAADFPPLRGVIHAAGVLDDGVLVQQTVERFRRVMAPKVLGGWNLHVLTREAPLDFFVLYSSAASLFGAPGQGNYVAANAFLDALAHHRRVLGLPGLSINWGPFSEVGLAAAQANRGARLAQRGSDSLTPTEGNAILGRLLDGDVTQMTVMPLELRKWVEFYPRARSSPWLSELVPASPGAGSGEARNVALLETLRTATRQEARVHLERFVREQLARVLRLDSARIDREAPLQSFGLDSLMGLELRNRLESGLGLSLPVSLIWRHPTLAALCEHLLSREEAGVEPGQALARPEVIPLSSGQERLWFLDRLSPGTPQYNVHLGIRVRGVLDIQVLRRSMGEVVRRHEVLRTRFPEVDGSPRQVIASPDTGFELTLVELPGLTEQEREEEIRRRSDELGRRPFDLSGGPLLRVTLLALGADDFALFVTKHHIITDGWSLGVFVRELSALYVAFVRGQTAPLPPVSMQFAEAALRERTWLAGESGARERAYWKGKLTGLPPLQLPVDHAVATSTSHRGATVPFSLSPALSEALRELASREGCSLFMVLFAGFAALLHRYSGQVDFGVGTVIANRGNVPSDLIGFVANTLALRCELSGEPTFAQWLARAREVVLEALDHQALPFSEVVQAVGASRDGGLNPLVRACFTLENIPAPALELPGTSWSFLNGAPDGSVEGMARFELSLIMASGEKGMAGMLEYSKEVFDTSTAARMVGHFQVLLEAIVAHPEVSLSKLPLLTAEERGRLLVEWNDTALDVPAVCMHELVQAQVERTPRAVAVVSGQRTLTYAELNRRANQLAHYLRRLGVRPEVRVGICVERTEDVVIGLLAILKAGGAYVPLDPAYPKERLALILEDAQVPVLLTQQRLVSELPSTTARIVCLDTDWPVIGDESDGNLERTTAPEKLAYLIYTSGSTGKPKGVMIEHRNAVAFLVWALRVFSPGELAGTLASTSICFDLSVFEIFTPLCCGAKVIIAKNALELPELSAAREVTLINTVPSAMGALLRAGAVPPSVATVNLAGEALAGALVEQLYQLEHVRQVFNLYGPSETTTYSTFTRVGRGQTPTIGRPIGNTHIYVLDPNKEPMPTGVPGEVYIGGAGVARGYLGRPELTAERFVRSPFGGDPEARLYRTGDLARWLSDGRLEYLGRMDHQVKLRGFRIELGEIGEVLMEHPGVREAVVVVREGVGTEKQLVAYVVARGEKAPAPAELRSYLKSKLPEYMVPFAFVSLDTMPLTPNGKVDRAALPAPESMRSGPVKEHVAPRTPEEEALAAIWRQVLGVKQIGVRDNFFELGGHSLLLYRVLVLARSASGADIPLRALLRAPTLEEMARAIEAARTGSLPAHDVVAEMEADAVLDAEIDPKKVPPPVAGAPRTLLLTGATGFLGAFLLEELCRKTEARIYCLVRSATEQDGMHRIRKNLEGYSLWSDALASRIVPLRGDISQPLLGLSETEFQRLSEEVDAIYHNGALVNFLYPYESLRAANVLGTREILRLATRTRAKTLHYVSTVSVLPLGRKDPIREDEPLDVPTSLVGGYSQSKWVAEKLVREASRRGLPVTILRPGRVTGHSRTGAWNTDDLVCRTLKGCVRMGMAPRVDALLDLTPVDYVSSAIVDLSMSPESIGQTYHLVNPRLVRADEMWSYMQAFGYGLRILPYDEWLAELASVASSDSELGDLLMFLQQVPPEDRSVGGPRMVVCDCSHTLKALEGTATSCPSVDVALVSTYLSSLVRRGFFEAPVSKGEGRT
ncbi:non-ribosomal peptide synthetase/type I polyketide synthase [Archangium sp.]|uniref:non-ribosomal peptide synthetase/type I polyketide synthase n=1 Tax=Archangium sp. TaxID=1872627 RepID=UPI002D417D90|nr:non-ribosomal peptide synthetase/type I polyketide synthase [Archangium sp.]HYO60253.1 amino acid adenylation domain-containing protein [Archangium sp.]